MGTSFIVVPFVSIGVFPLTENLVSFGLTLMRELRIGGTTVDKEWCFRLFEVRLLRLCEERLMGQNSRPYPSLLTSRSSGTFKRDGWETTLTLMSFSNARLKT